ncbi:allantoicase [Thraustotheca clavata]|uniref:Allantoicase n=1 Tax=Thraustotheca clavata TaxID=74557 RepID=A0A1V9YYL4_9STRA|nr:allantoicase [Thraustotheca clavata]
MPKPSFTTLTCLSTKGHVLFATDEWFASADNLLLTSPPVFIPEKFTDFGKWMDGWETRRKRIPGHDWCVIKLGLRGKIAGIDIDTAFFTGNNAPRVSIQAACLPEGKGQELTRERQMGTCASSSESEAIEKLGSESWHEILPRTELNPGYEESRHHYFEIANDQVWTHLRVNIFPDGGIARLKVYGIVSVDWDKVPADASVDLVAAANGGTIITYSDAHFGEPKNLLMPGRGINMGDGWETARKKTRPAILTADEKGLLTVPGKDWVIIQLGHIGIIDRIEIDTHHFKGNYPESCFIEGRFHQGQASTLNEQTQWRPLLPRTKLGPDAQHYFGKDQLVPGEAINHVRLTIYPDGGISRLRIWGRKALLGRL